MPRTRCGTSLGKPETRDPPPAVADIGLPDRDPPSMLVSEGHGKHFHGIAAIKRSRRGDRRSIGDREAGRSRVCRGHGSKDNRPCGRYQQQRKQRRQHRLNVPAAMPAMMARTMPYLWSCRTAILTGPGMPLGIVLSAAFRIGEHLVGFVDGLEFEGRARCGL